MIHLTLEQAFFLIIFIIIFVVIAAELIASISWRRYLNRKRDEGLGKVTRRSRLL